MKSTFIDGYGTVLFADIVSFTTFSQTLTAPQLVIMLNAMFMKFDRLAEKNEVSVFLGEQIRVCDFENWHDDNYCALL